MPAHASSSSYALSPVLARTLNTLEQVAWSQASSSCTTTRSSAAAALFGASAGIWKDAAISATSKVALQRLDAALRAAAVDGGAVNGGDGAAATSTTTTTMTDSAAAELPGWRELLHDLNEESARRIGKVGVVFGTARVVGRPETRHCFTIVVAPHVVANRFWVFDTLGATGARRSAMDEATAQAFADAQEASLCVAREIYKHHEKHLRFGIDSLAQRLFPFGEEEPREISEWYPVWLE
jgi:hypothetical protein